MGVLYIAAFRLLPYAALIIFALGLAYRLRGLARTPVPLRVGLGFPGPAGGAGRHGALAALLASLWRRSPLLALGAMALHLGLFLALLGHLRFFFSTVPPWLYFLTPLSRAAGYFLVAGLVILLMRRLADPRLWHLSRAVDYAFPALLMALALSGLALAHWSPPDPRAIKALALGLAMPWRPIGPWPGALVCLHLALALVFLAAFPFSKLMHGPELFYNPLIWERPASRLEPHENPWEAHYLGDAPSREAVLPGEPPPLTLEDYHRRLKDHWAAHGTSQVLSAGQRLADRERP